MSVEKKTSVTLTSPCVPNCSPNHIAPVCVARRRNQRSGVSHSSTPTVCANLTSNVHHSPIQGHRVLEWSQTEKLIRRPLDQHLELGRIYGQVDTLHNKKQNFCFLYLLFLKIHQRYRGRYTNSAQELLSEDAAGVSNLCRRRYGIPLNLCRRR